MPDDTRFTPKNMPAQARRPPASAASPPTPPAPAPRQAQATPQDTPPAPTTAGPLRDVLSLHNDRMTLTGPNNTHTPLGPDANAVILLRRTAFPTYPTADTVDLSSAGRDALLAWSCQHRLGQQPADLATVRTRRDAAVTTLLEQHTTTQPDTEHRQLRLRPEWHMLVGASDRTGPYEIGLTLHDTYGWPLLPASTLKGAARAWAGANDIDTADITRVCGPEPAADPSGHGTVVFFDALPDLHGVRIIRDGQTPHQQPYYAGKQPPADWHNPIPSMFLAIDAGSFVVDLLGPRADVALAATWVQAAADDLGIGAKTAAGYGYLTLQGTPP